MLATMPVNFRSGAAVPQAEESKYRKHFDACISAGYHFLGFALNAFGVLAPDASAFLHRLASLLETSQGLPSYLAKRLVFRRISFAVHFRVARQLIARSEFQIRLGPEVSVTWTTGRVLRFDYLIIKLYLLFVIYFACIFQILHKLNQFLYSKHILI